MQRVRVPPPEHARWWHRYFTRQLAYVEADGEGRSINYCSRCKVTWEERWMLPPLHPNCRCAIDPLLNVEDPENV